MGLEYEVPGLAFVLRLKGQRPEWLDVVRLGDGGLGSRIDSDRRADIADVCVYCDGGDVKWVDCGLDGEARGMMSLGSGFPAE